MNEDFLQFAWRFRLFDSTNLHTTNGEPIVVHSPGHLNRSDGPDFTDARISIAGTRWAGQVEIHARTSEWMRHGHQNDRAYRNTILHVVYLHDDPKGSDHLSQLPTLELKDRIDPGLIRKYRTFMAAKTWIPCEPHLPRVPGIHIFSMLERMVVARLEARFETWRAQVALREGDIRQATWQLFVRYFGFGRNNAAFELLATQLPAALIDRYRTHRLQLEALLFGVSGLLAFTDKSSHTDAYRERLAEEFTFLQNKHNLPTMQPHVWKHAGLRPANFPSVRLAQLCALLSQPINWVDALIQSKSLEEVRAWLANSTPSAYWQDHYRFGVPAPRGNTALGSESIDLLLLNAVIPLRFAWHRWHQQEILAEECVGWWQQLPPEKNRTIRKWKDLGVQARNAADTQALLHLKTYFCDHKKCLTCSIGTSIITRND